MIFSMTKRLWMTVIIAFFCITISSAQDVRYFKLTRKEENGKSFTNVSGGQFITFVSDMCFESDKYGVGVGHGTLTKNKTYSSSDHTTFQGSSYWGKGADFIFNSDKSVLNVVLENGDVYIYKRATAPSGQETCSLIRKSGGGGSGTIVTTPPVNPGGQVVMPPINPTSPTNPGGTTPTPSHGRTAHQVTKTCLSCGGSGRCSTCNGKHYYQSFGNTVTCPNCPPNGACQSCGGSGKKATTEWW